MDPQHRALQLYQQDPDPLLLDAIRVLGNPEDPLYADVLQMLQLWEDLLHPENPEP